MGPKRRARRLFVTGATGYLGSHLLADAETDRWQIIAPPSRALDLRSAASVDMAIADWRPSAVVHTAYRRDDRTAIVDASRHVARAAARYGARLIHVSTDALFEGRLAPYDEREPPTPVTAYGRDKADAELVVRAECPRAVIVRTSLLVAGRRPGTQEQLVADVVSGTSTTRFFTDEVRSPVRVEDVASGLLALAADGSVHGNVHLGGPRPFDRYELALAIAELNDWPTHRIAPTSLAEQGLTRPTRVVLDSSRATALGITLRGPTRPAARRPRSN